MAAVAAVQDGRCDRAREERGRKWFKDPAGNILSVLEEK
jgi:hypothetical protein